MSKLTSCTKKTAPVPFPAVAKPGLHPCTKIHRTLGFHIIRITLIFHFISTRHNGYRSTLPVCTLSFLNITLVIPTPLQRPIGRPTSSMNVTAPFTITAVTPPLESCAYWPVTFLGHSWIFRYGFLQYTFNIKIRPTFFITILITFTRNFNIINKTTHLPTFWGFKGFVKITKKKVLYFLKKTQMIIMC